MPKNFKNIFSKNWFLAIIVFLICFIVYILTLAPTVSVDDSGELISAAYNLGIPHPSGYPLWTMLGFIFSHLPFCSPAFGVNLMSAVFGSLTAAVLFLLILEILIFIRMALKAIAFSASLILAFTNLFWKNSVVAEVYTLNTFFVVIIIYLLLLWQEKKENKYLLWTAFLFGLSLTNHQMMALMAPAVLVFAMLENKKILKNPDLTLKILLLFILGLSIYLYLPIASYFKPAIDWGHPNNWQSFWAHISRAQYVDFVSGFNLSSKLNFLGAFVLLLARELYLIPLILALIGIWVLFKKNFKLALFLFLTFLGNNIFLIILRHAPYGIINDYLYEFYYLPSLLIIIIWLSVALTFLLQRFFLFFTKRKYFLIIKILTLILILFWPVFLLIKNWQKNDQNNFWLVNDYARSMLRDIEPNAVLVHSGWGSIGNDTEIFSLIYALTVEKLRPDIYLLTDLNLWPHNKIKIDKEYLQANSEERRKKLLTLGAEMAKTENRTLYTDFSVTEDLLPDKIVSRSIGNVYKIFPSLSEAREFKISNFELPTLHNLSDEHLNNNFSASDIIARYYYRLATFYLEQNQKDLAENYLQKAIQFNQDTDNRYLKDFITKREEWLGVNQLQAHQ